MSPQSDLAAYRRVLSALREQILSGALGEGDKLPSVREIVAEYHVATGTAARAINALQAEGLVVTRHGSGVYVRTFRKIPRSSPARLSRERWGSGQAIQDTDVDPQERERVADIEVGETVVPEFAAGPLQVAPGSSVIFRSRRYIIDDRPVQIATSYFPPELVRGTAIMHTDTGPGGSYARLAEQGHAPMTFTEYVRARMPIPTETERLGLTEGVPVIEITRHALEAGGRCVEVNRMILDGSAYLLDYTFPA